MALDKTKIKSFYLISDALAERWVVVLSSTDSKDIHHYLASGAAPYLDEARTYSSKDIAIKSFHEQRLVGWKIECVVQVKEITKLAYGYTWLQERRGHALERGLVGLGYDERQYHPDERLAREAFVVFLKKSIQQTQKELEKLNESLSHLEPTSVMLIASLED